MSGSLKGYIPALSRLLGLSPAALYERQRALVRDGLLVVEAGKGPGSGVRLTPSAKALLILSVLATDRLSDSSERTREIAEAGSALGGCPLTRRENFHAALTWRLSASGTASAVRTITVSRTSPWAALRYWDDETGAEGVSEFGGPAACEPGLSVVASLTGALLQQIAQDVQLEETEAPNAR
jgi:hypothetical protein